MMTPVTTWIDGAVQTLPSNDPRLSARDEARKRLMHVWNMRPLDLAHRRLYLANVAEREGVEAAEQLKAAFAADWKARRA